MVSTIASLKKSNSCAVPVLGTIILLLEASSSVIDPH